MVVCAILDRNLVFGLTAHRKTQIDAFTGFHQRGQPAGANCGGVAVARHIEIGMKNAVHYDVVTAFGVHRCGGREYPEWLWSRPPVL